MFYKYIHHIQSKCENILQNTISPTKRCYDTEQQYEMWVVSKLDEEHARQIGCSYDITSITYCHVDKSDGLGMTSVALAKVVAYYPTHTYWCQATNER